MTNRREEPGGEPISIGNLAQLPLIAEQIGPMATQTWTLTSRQGEPAQEIRFTPRAAANDVQVICDLIRRGAGIGRLSTFFGDQVVAGGSIRRVLPNWSGPSFDVVVL